MIVHLTSLNKVPYRYIIRKSPPAPKSLQSKYMKQMRGRAGRTQRFVVICPIIQNELINVPEIESRSDESKGVKQYLLSAFTQIMNVIK